MEQDSIRYAREIEEASGHAVEPFCEATGPMPETMTITDHVVVTDTDLDSLARKAMREAFNAGVRFALDLADAGSSRARIMELADEVLR